ncbi:TAXI family TRAP transporter solute-binding subunit [Fodinicurvata fenggangensis]|uniref:TAXI family TRAP transporter solute-binding subunit n=1 Tax=Fodinicurvata fenggangensis TaxID=1121830 RepID=UPI00047D453A|nr:TAXI family TRAP transporter solute-binding subunit [Fodinicurvata fenggangensis]
MKHLMLSVAAGAMTLGLASTGTIDSASAQDKTEVRWATSSTGSSGYRALTSLANMLNNQMDTLDITVMPTPGAAASVRGFAGGQFDGYYGADVAFHEIANNGGRYEGFADQEHEQQMTQSFWAYTLEVGLGVLAEDTDELQSWQDLNGKPVFTSPAPWDTRAALERAMRAAGVEHEYVELDTGLAAQSLEDGTIEAMIIYTAGETSPSPWIQEAMMSADMDALNPSSEELDMLDEAGIGTVEVPPGVFDDQIGDPAILVPFFYGFHVGTNFSEDEVYEMLVTIEENAEELAESDPSFSQVRDDMVEMQLRGIRSAGETIPIHPGLAKFLRENDAWNADWDGRIASMD